jgi:nucleoside-diphosphate-sugar epimerase
LSTDSKNWASAPRFARSRHFLRRDGRAFLNRQQLESAIPTLSAEAPTSDWSFIYIDDAADAAVAACFSRQRRELHYFISYPEQVSLDQIIDAAAQSGARPKVSIDDSRTQVRRRPLDIGPAQFDFVFAPRVDHRTDIASMISARRVP